jgi:NADH-quinone oxidoreductase subunit H
MLLALHVAFWTQTIIKVVVILVVIPTGALVLVYVYLFKMVSHLQSRLGPMEAGFHGVLQPIAEGVKFLQKEDIFPAAADRMVFAAAPLVVLISTFMVYIVIPAGPTAVIEDLDTGIFFALAVSSLSVIGILMAGWASANKYSLMGGLRAAGQLIAYELPMVLAVVGVVIQAGTMNLQQIVWRQNSEHAAIFGWNGLGNPYLFTQLIGFVIFMIAVQAELTQTPFDMPVAESELVSGYMTEYSGFRFLIFFIAEFATVGVFSLIASVLFLGGWGLPFSWFGWHTGTTLFGGVDNWMNVVGPLILFTKMIVLSFLVMWVRFSYPRLREDQLQRFAWKVLIPISLLNIMATAILKVAF